MRKTSLSFTYYTIFFIMLAISTYFVTSFAKGPDLENYVTITVSAGDTLWALADEYESQHKLSVREFVLWVEKINNIEHKAIIPGEELYIPVLKKDFKDGEMLASNK